MGDTDAFYMHVEVDGFPHETFDVAEWTCSEGLSQLSNITVLAYAPADVDTSALLHKNARVIVFRTVKTTGEVRAYVRGPAPYMTMMRQSMWARCSTARQPLETNCTAPWLLGRSRPAAPLLDQLD